MDKNDGASDVAGKHKVLLAQVLRVNLKALFTQCATHCLNNAVIVSWK